VATLGALALNAAQLDTAEVALAALGMVDKLAFVLHVRDIPSAEGQAAEMALLRRNPDEAETILLQASPPLVYRAVKLNIRLFRWERALGIAKDADGGRAGPMMEMVVGYRQQLLEELGREETLESFRVALSALGPSGVDWERVAAFKAAQHEEEERAVSTGKYGGNA
jgi:intraflagellar transport protein 80